MIEEINDEIRIKVHSRNSMICTHIGEEDVSLSLCGDYSMADIKKMIQIIEDKL